MYLRINTIFITGMPLKEKETPKLFYTIGEVAKKFNVNPSLIRFWEKEFGFFKPRKNKKGDRLFTNQDIDAFHKIYHLVKERGFTLQGAKEKLAVQTNDTDTTIEIVKSLDRIKSLLLDLKRELGT